MGRDGPPRIHWRKMVGIMGKMTGRSLIHMAAVSLSMEPTLSVECGSKRPHLGARSISVMTSVPKGGVSPR